MKIKTSEMTGEVLNWAVAKCEGWEFTYENYPQHEMIFYSPSTDWAHGGPIIEREGIALLPPGLAEMPGFEGRGDTLLIAAMRCYVASKMGDEVVIPEGLTT